MTNTRESLSLLAGLEQSKYMVSNLYLRLMPEDRADKKYLVNFKDMVKKQREYLLKRNLEKEVLEAVEEDFKLMEEFLSEPENLKGCRGIAIFSKSEEKVFEVVKLPYVYRNRLMVSPDPLIREIVAIEEEFGKVGVILVDRKHIRFFLMDVESITEELDFIEPLATRSRKFHAGGHSLKGAEGSFRVSIPARGTTQHAYGEWRFHMRIQEEWHRVLKLASDGAFENWKETKFNKLIVGGFIEEGLREIENHLHPYLRNILVGYVNINPATATEHEVREKALELLWQKDREQEKELIEELQELTGKGLAVSGTSKVLEMLAIGNVRTLLVPEDFEKPGFLCPNSHLVFLKPECPVEGEEPVEIEDVVDEAIEEALDQRATVEVIIDKELQRKVDGLGAFLRFPI